MAYTRKTLLDLKQGLADRHDSGILPTSSVTLNFWTRLLNRGQAYCADKLRLEKSTDLTTSSGSIALPDDFLIVNRIFNDEDVELYQIDKDDVESRVGLAFWITGTQTAGFTLNVATDNTVTVYYAFKPEEMVNNTDVCVIPDPEAVVAYAYSHLRKSETDPIEDAQDAMDECNKRLAEIMSQQNINNNFTGFTI
jgi:hypothetical protein